MRSPGNPSFARACLVALMWLSYADTYVLGAPKGSRVVAGTATFTQEGNLTVITAANRSIINYQSFNIGSNEIVRFVQPNADSSVLNRILNPNPTNIFGQIQANGNVYIVNPYGVFFRNGSVLNVGGLYAGAGKLSDADFTSGNIHFTDLAGDVRNDGVIAADNRIALLGANVVNNGTLSSAHGVAMMVSGPDVYVGERNGNIFVQANGAAVASTAAGSIANHGTVAAPRVLLGAGDLYSTAIVNTGLLQGRGIAVNAGQRGTATIGGRLNASSTRNPNRAGTGGRIQVLGGQVALRGAALNASGTNGGGSVRVGGDMHGGGTLLQAATTTVDAATTIDADATGPKGDGGSVVLWSGTQTYFGGNISARGGSVAGDGGSVEVSSHESLLYRGLANLSATAGRTGSLLLDPSEIYISDTTQMGTTSQPVTVANPTVAFGTGATGAAPVTVAVTGLTGLNTALATANVQLQANDNIYVYQSIAPAGGTNSLTLNAGNSIYVGDTSGTHSNIAITLGGPFIATFNDAGATVADRVAGAAVFAMGTGASITARGGVTISGGILDANATNASGQLSANTGAVTLLGINTSSATTGVASGLISVTNNAAAGKNITAGGGLVTTATTGTANGGAVTLNSSGTLTVNAITANGIGATGASGVLALTGTTAISLNGAIAGATLTTSGPTTFNAGSGVTTTGLQTYNGALTLAANTTLTATSGDITFNNAIDGSAAATYSLEVDTPGNEIFGGRIGTTATPLNLTTDAAGTVGGAAEFTMTLPGALATNKAGVNLGGALNVHDAVLFNVGGVPAATSPSVATAGAQTYHGAASLLADTYLTSGSTLVFDSTIAGGAAALTLNSTGTITLGGAATGLVSFGTVGTETVDLNGGTVTTSGAQTYGGPAVLGVDTTLTSTGGGTIALAAVSGGQALTVESEGATGQVTLGGTIGSGTALTSLAVTAATAINLNGNTVATTGTLGQVYTGPVVLGSTSATPLTTLTASGGGPIDFAGSVAGLAATSQALAVDTTTAAPATAGLITFGGAIGSAATPLASVTTTAGAVDINGGAVTTSGAQTYGATVTLGSTAATPLTTLTAGTLTSNLLINGGGTQSLTLALTNAASLESGTAATAGVVTLNNINNLVSGGAGGTTLAGNLTTAGGQSYTDAVTLGTTLTLTSNATTAVAGPISFSGPVNGTAAGAQGLTVSTVGETTFGGAVGSGATGVALASLATTGMGGVDFAGVNVTTSGAQSYTGPITLSSGATILDSTGSTVTAGSVTGGGFDLTVDATAAAGSTASTFGTITGAGALTFADNTGTAVFTGSIGGTSFDSTGAGGVTFNTTAMVTTSGSQTYTGTLTLGGATTLASSGSTVTAGPVTGGGFDLTVDATAAAGSTASTFGAITDVGALNVADNTGTAVFNGGIGATSINSTGAGGVTFNQAETITTAGLQNYAGTLTLSGATTLNSTGSTVSAGGVMAGGFDLTVDATAAAGSTASTFGPIAGAGTLIFADNTGTAVFAGNIGGTSFDSTGAGGVTFNTAAMITTSGSQTYTGTLTLGGATTLDSTGSSVSAGSVTGGGFNLGVTAASSTFGAISGGGNLTFADGAGTAAFTSTVAGTSLTRTGAGLTTLANNVTTTGVLGQSYSGPLQLENSLSLTSQATAPISFSGTVDGIGQGTQSLTIVNDGTTTFNGAVGSSEALGSLTISGDTTAATGTTVFNISGNPAVATAANSLNGAQTYNNAVQLEQDTTLQSTFSGGATAGGNVTFGATVDSFNATPHALTINTSGEVFFAGAVGSAEALSSLDAAGGGAINLNGGPITTSGSQTYAGPVFLGAATTLTGTTLTVGSTVDGAGATGPGSDGLGSNDLTLDFSATPINPTSGTYENIANFTSSGAGGTTLSGSFQTTGSQTYANAVTLTAASTLNSGGNGNITFDSTVRGADVLTLDPNGTGTAVFGGVVGGPPSASNLTALTVNGNASITGGGSITTSGTQDYTGTLSLGLATALASTGGEVEAGSLTGNSHNLNVNAQSSSFGTITSGGDLVFTIGTGPAAFTGAVAAASLTTIGNVTVDLGDVTTSDATGQVYGGPVLLHTAATTTLTANGGGPITFDSTLNGSTALTLAAAGLVTFHGAVGGSTPLTSLSTSTGTVDLDGGSVATTSGGQSYGGPVVLGAAIVAPATTVTTTLTDAGGGAIIFHSSIAGTAAGQGLSLGTSGTVTLDGTVGSAGTPLASLVTTGAGPVDLNGGTVNTSGLQDYAGTLTLGAPTTLTSTGGEVEAGALIGNSDTLAVNAVSSSFGTITTGGALTFTDSTGPATFTGPVTAISLQTVGSAPADLNGGSVTTSGAVGQVYGGPVVLGPAAETLTANGGAPLTFDATVNASAGMPATLSLGTTGLITLTGAVGGSRPLGGLTTTGGGTVDINGGLVATSGGGQTYSGPVVLGALAASSETTDLTEANGAITFQGTVDGNAAGTQALVVSTPGNTTFSKLVGSVQPLLSLSAGSPTPGATITLNGVGSAASPTVATTGGQTYNGKVLLGNATFLQGTTLTLNGSMDGAGATGTGSDGLASNDLTLTFSVSPVHVTGKTAAGGTAGAFNDIANFLSNGAGGTILGGSFQTTGSQTYANAATLTADASLTTGGNGGIDFQTTVQGPHGLTLNPAGTGIVTFNGVVGGATSANNLAGLLVNGNTSITGGGAVTSSGAQFYTGTLTLGVMPTTLTSTAGEVEAGSLVGNGNDLTVDAQSSSFGTITSGGNLTFNIDAGQMGFSGPVAAVSLTTGTGQTVLTGGAVTTDSLAIGQSYGGSVRLGANTVLADTSHGPITFNGPIDGAVSGQQTLSVNTGGLTTFDGTVGLMTPLASLTTDQEGIAGEATVFNASGLAVTTVNNGVANGGGTQTYNDAVRLEADTTLQSNAGTAATGGDITFGTVVDSYAATPRALTVNTTGNEIFNGLVGSSHLLLSLATDAAGGAGGQAEFDMTIPAASPGVAGVSVGTGGVTVNDQAVFDVAGSSSAKFPVSGTNNPTIASAGPQQYTSGTAALLEKNTVLVGTSLTIPGGVTGLPAGSNNLTVDFSGLANLPLGNFSGLNNFASVGSGGTQIAGAFTTVGYQYYANPVTVGAAATLTSSGGKNVTFITTVDGANSLAIDTAGDVTFDGLVGNATPLTALSIGTAGGTTHFSMSLTGLPAGTAGVNVGAGGVSVADLVSFNVAGSAPGSLVTVQSVGPQTYALAATLAQDTVLASTGGGDITFDQTVDGTFHLALDSAGNEVFDGQVGATTPLLSLRTDVDLATPGGSTVFNVPGGATTVTTLNNVAPSGTATGAQVYDDGVLLEQGTTLESTFTGPATTGGPITFNGTIDSHAATAQSLTVLAGVGETVIGAGATLNAARLNIGGAQVTFNQPVGAAQALNVLTVASNGSLAGVTPAIDINNGGFTTAGGQTYSDAVILSADTLLADTSGQAIVFEKTVNGDGVLPRSLTLNTGSTVTFDGLVGNVDALRQLSVATVGGTFFEMPLTGLAAGVAGVNVRAGGVTVTGPATFNVAGSSLGDLTHLTVSTTGPQTYNGPVSLSQNTSLYGSNGGDIALNGTVDGGVSLALNTSGDEIFSGVLGGATPLKSLTTDALITPGGQAEFTMALSGQPAGVRVGAGGVTINDGVLFDVAGSTLAAPSVLTFNGGTQTYRLAANMTADTVLVGDASSAAPPTGGMYSGGGAIVFGSTVTGTGTTPSLTVRTGAGTTTFDGAVSANAINVTGAQVTFGDAVSALNVVSIAPNGGVAGGPIDLDGGTAAGYTVQTKAGQTYGSTVALGTDSLLADTGGGNITFNSTLNGLYALTINTAGSTVFNAAVGNTAALRMLTTDAPGATYINGGSVNTANKGQFYNDAVILGGATVLTDNTVAPPGRIVFGSTVDSASAAAPSALTVNAGGVTFAGAVGAGVPLLSLTTIGSGATEIDGGSVTTTGLQSYGSSRGALIGAPTTLAAGSNISLLGTLDAVPSAANSALTLTAPGQILFTGAVGAATPLTSLAVNAGTLLVNGGTVATTLAQTYNSSVVLGQTTTFQSVSNGNIAFNGLLDGAFGLTVNTGGITAFNAKVGGQTALTSLTTDNEGQAGEATQFNMNAAATAVNPAGVNVAGPVTINDAVVFNVANSSAANPTVQSLNSTQTYGGPASMTADTVLTATGGGNLVFAAAVDGTFNLALNTSGLTILNGLVGGNARLASLTTDAGGTTQINGGGVSTTINGGAATGAQVYNDAVSLGADAVLASAANGAGTTAGNLVFNSTLDGTHALTLNTSGQTIFAQAVGSLSPLLSLTTNAAGVTQINGGSVLTTGAQTYGDPVQLGAATTLTSQNTAGDTGAITFSQTVDGHFALTANTSGATIFDGAVGGAAALVSVTTDAPGTTQLNGGSVSTTGLQTYADAVLLGAATTLISQNTANDGGAITFGQTVDNGFALTINTSGQTIFNGLVGGMTPLVSVSTDASGSTVMNGGGVKTTGLQTYGDLVQLQTATTLASLNTAGDSGAITFSKTINGGDALTVNTSGQTIFDGAIGNEGALSSLKTDAPGQTIFANGNVTTTGAQSYGDAVRLKATGLFVSQHDGNITFNKTLDGPFAVTIDTAGETVFGGLVGGNTPLLSITTDKDGSTVFGGGGANTKTTQTYGDAVTLTADATLTSQSPSGEAISFNKTIDGNAALTLATAGRMVFGGAVGGAMPLASLTTAGTGTAVFDGGEVKTTGAQSYAGNVTLGAGTTDFTTTGAGDITFQQTVDGAAADANALVLDTTGATLLNGNVGVSTRLASLTVTGPLSIGGETVSTSGDQDYQGEVSLNPQVTTDTQILSGSGNLRFEQDVTSQNGSLLAQGHRILAQGDITTAGNLNLETETVPPSVSATAPLLLLTGKNYISSAGQVEFNTTTTAPSPSDNTSTIVISDTGTVNIQGTGFTMGYLQKIFSLGTLDINVGHGVATIGDIAARENLRIEASEVQLLARPMGATQNGRPNDGLNFVADQSINFGQAKIVFVGTENPTANFITTNGLTTIQRIAGISLFKDPNLDSQFRPYTGGFDANNFTLVDNPFQPVGGGSQSLDTAAALSGALPDQKPLDVAVDITITASQMEELKKLGIHPRLAQRAERQNANSKRSLFAQLVDGQDPDNYGRLQPIKGGISRLEPSDYVVVVDRMGEREVQSIIKAFEDLYGKNKEKAPEIGAAFQTAFDDYTVQKQTADPAGFSPYLQSQPGKYPAVESATRSFDNLFGHIEHLGLTDKEVGKSEEHIVSDLGVSGVSPEDMVKVINNLRKKLPPAQKASSTKAPASAPVGNPAPGATAPAPPSAPKKDQPAKTARGQKADSWQKAARRTKPAKPDQRYDMAAL